MKKENEGQIYSRIINTQINQRNLQLNIALILFSNHCAICGILRLSSE